jgi:hypothetical protein
VFLETIIGLKQILEKDNKIAMLGSMLLEAEMQKQTVCRFARK